MWNLGLEQRSFWRRDHKGRRPVINVASQMRELAQAFNQPVDFDTRNVESMVSMFVAAASFNQPLDFDTSKGTGFDGMFYNASAFAQDISHWSTASRPSRPPSSTTGPS